jgi:quercetin dioxygenase-like cupin family protein
MTPATPSAAFRPERPGQRIDIPFISVDVPLEIARLRAERAYEQDGHAGRTLVKYPDLRVVLETMKRGTRLPFHETAERMTLQVVLGQLRVSLRPGEVSELSEGTFTAIDAARVHEIESLDESAFLLTLAWPPAGNGANGGGQAGAGSGI